MHSQGVSIHHLNKSFGANRVLDDVSLELAPGALIGLMGPNGAGKSTLIKILAGIYTADRGELRVGEQRVASLANRADVGFVHQDLGLVEDLSITENLRLGQPPMRRLGPLLDRAAEREAAERTLGLVGLSVPVETEIAALSPGEKTLVAIARAFQTGATTLFVDEATSTLPPPDARRVVETLSAKAAEGATVVMITHKLSEVLEYAAHVVVLLDGRVATDEPTAGLDRAGLVRRLVAHESSAAVEDATPVAVGDEVLGFDRVTHGVLGPVDLSLRRGEVVGLTGLPGSGLHDVAFLAHGALRPTGGTIRVAPGVRRALVPPHRETQGGFAEMSVRDNLTMSALRRWRSRLRFLRLGAEHRSAVEMVDRLSVRPGDPDGHYGVLSGGNKQKVIFGRVLFERPDVYVLCEPTRGVDVTTRAEIYRLIRELRAQDAAILVVSSDAEDLFAVCDRIGVVSEGLVGEPRPVESMDPTELEVLV